MEAGLGSANEFLVLQSAATGGSLHLRAGPASAATKEAGSSSPPRSRSAASRFPRADDRRGPRSSPRGSRQAESRRAGEAPPALPVRLQAPQFDERAQYLLDEEGVALGPPFNDLLQAGRQLARAQQFGDQTAAFLPGERGQPDLPRSPARGRRPAPDPARPPSISGRATRTSSRGASFVTPSRRSMTSAEETSSQWQSSNTRTRGRSLAMPAK